MCRKIFCFCWIFLVFTGKISGQFTERELTGFDLSTNKVNLVHRLWPQLNGRGSTISIKEELMDTTDIDFLGRYLKAASAATILQTHATTMTTIVAGAGNSFYTGKGVAWGANISSSDFNNLLPDKLTELQQLKVAIQNHSYGVGLENYYGNDAAAYDIQLNQDSTILHVFSSGNMGDKSPITGVYQGVVGFSNLTGSFKMAKNIVTVGATDSFYRVIPISSRGPAFDGRIKPEIVALGEDGSSGAAAIVSGISMLIRDAFILYHPSKKAPSSAMIKAILINSADDINQPGIDYNSGFGSANAWRSIKTVKDGQLIQGAVSANQTNQHLIQIPINAINLKVTICWIDPASAANTPKTLINNLDLEMVHASNTSAKILPWVLSSLPNLTALQSLPFRGLDSLNNVEQITLSNPLAGNYQISVIGKNIATSNQAYSIVWQYDLADDFIFTYPVKGDQLFPLKNNTIRWETGITGTASIQSSINNGPWQMISSNIDLSKKYFSWFSPDSIGTVQLRMVKGQNMPTSDTVILAPIISAKTGFNCPDSFLLYWQKQPVKKYQVYQLGQQYQEPFLTVSDTAVIFQKWNVFNQVFTVAPVFANNITGLSGYAFDYTKQGIGCYVKGFLADPSGAKNAQLSLQLGTTFQVKKVIFEKKTTTGFVTIYSISPVVNDQINAIVAATKGLNIYRAKIELENGSVIYSNLEQVLIFDGNPFYLFPNPAPSGSLLKLMSENPDNLQLMITDIMGKKIHVQKINSYIEYIQLPLIPQGVYYVSVLGANTILKTFPLIVSK